MTVLIVVLYRKNGGTGQRDYRSEEEIYSTETFQLSERGKLESTTLIDMYLQEGMLKAKERAKLICNKYAKEK